LQVFKFANQLGILKEICNKALGETWATGEHRLPFSPTSEAHLTP